MLHWRQARTPPWTPNRYKLPGPLIILIILKTAVGKATNYFILSPVYG